MCTRVHISVTKWRIVGYLSYAFWDICEMAVDVVLCVSSERTYKCIFEGNKTVTNTNPSLFRLMSVTTGVSSPCLVPLTPFAGLHKNRVPRAQKRGLPWPCGSSKMNDYVSTLRYRYNTVRHSVGVRSRNSCMHCMSCYVLMVSFDENFRIGRQLYNWVETWLPNY